MVRFSFALVLKCMGDDYGHMDLYGKEEVEVNWLKY